MAGKFHAEIMHELAHGEDFAHGNRMQPDRPPMRVAHGLRNLAEPLPQPSSVFAMAEHFEKPVGSCYQKPYRQQRAIDQVHSGRDILNVALVRRTNAKAATDFHGST